MPVNSKYPRVEGVAVDPKSQVGQMLAEAQSMASKGDVVQASALRNKAVKAVKKALSEEKKLAIP